MVVAQRDLLAMIDPSALRTRRRRWMKGNRLSEGAQDFICNLSLLLSVSVLWTKIMTAASSVIV